MVLMMVAAGHNHLLVLTSYSRAAGLGAACVYLYQQSYSLVLIAAAITL